MGTSALLFRLTWIAMASPPGSPPAASLGLPEPYSLTYRSIEGCPTEEQIRRDIAAHVRHGIRTSGVEIAIRITGADDRFTGQLSVADRFGADNHQSLAGTDCLEIAHALAFLAGIAVELGERRQADLAATSVRQPGNLSAHEAPEPAPRSFKITALTMAGITGGLSDIPSPVGEVGVALDDVTPRVFAPSLVAALLIAGGSHIAGQRGTAELSLLGGRLTACPMRFSKSKLELRPCIAATLGEVWGHATSVTNPPTVTELWFSAEATAAFRWFITSSIIAEVEGGAVFPLERPQYAFAFQPNNQPLYTVPWVTGRVEAGIGYRF